MLKEEQKRRLDYALTSPDVAALLEALPNLVDIGIEATPPNPKDAEPVPPTTTTGPTDLKVSVPEGYIPRNIKVADGQVLTDVQLIAAAHKNNLSTLLYGPPGTGKTSMVLAAIPDCVVMAGTSETEASDFIGSWIQTPSGAYEWVDGPLVTAMEAGVPLLVDEISLIDPRSAASLYSVMDGRDKLYITMNPARGSVHAKAGFVVFGSCNPDAPGSIMSEALLSRFKLHVEVETDFGVAKKLGVDSKIVTVAKSLMASYRHNEVVSYPQLRDLLTYRDIHSVYGEIFALRNFISQAEVSDRETYSKAVQDVFGHRISSLLI